MNIERRKMFIIPDELFKEPFNEISSNAKIICAIRFNDMALENMFENLGKDKKYYEKPKRRTLDEIAKMTNLSFQQVYEAQEELKRFKIYED